MAKQLSQQAQVAQRIKQFAKSLGVKCKARSDSFSMGDSVNWEVENLDPETYAKINDFANEHQYGSFDGMEDLYGYTNSRNDIPQSKYVSGRNSFTDELCQKAWEFLKASAPDGDDKPLDYQAAKKLQWYGDEWSHTGQIEHKVYQILRGAGWDSETSYEGDQTRAFWETQKTVAPVAVARSSDISGHIEKHTHTKKGFEFFIVVMPDRVGRDEFDALLSECKNAGGWYSRQWGSTPGGFAFKTLEAAQNFLSNKAGSASDNGAELPATVNASLADKLQKIADGMQPAIDSKLAERETNTQKRMAQAAHARIEGERLKRVQQGLTALAALHSVGAVPAVLSHVTSKKAAYDLAGAKLEPVPNGYHAYPVDTGAPSLGTPAALAFWALLEEKTDAEKQAEELQRLINDLKFSKIPGYFPTPDPIIQQMIELAEIEPHHRILDPSAGHGAICDAVKPLCAEVKAIEVNSSLAEILDLKDYLIEGPRDFLSYEREELTSYDRILINPPFERMQDISHVLHAFKFLKPGGRMVAIMSEGAFFGSNSTKDNFTNWLSMNDAEVVELKAGDFKSSGTMVKTRIVVIDKEVN